jgi:plastocyanin
MASREARDLSARHGVSNTSRDRLHRGWKDLRLAERAVIEYAMLSSAHGMARGRVFSLIAFALLVTGCGSDAAPSPDPGPAPAATITITASGASPKSVTVSPGSQVLFVNSDSREHQMYSDPHPEHTDCPAFDQVGSLRAGQSRATGNLNLIRTCGFHDHLRFEDTSLRGSVIIR